jgi:3-oxoadipate enol-lactonase
MPTIALPATAGAPDAMLSYQVDDFTDPWSTPETVVFLHGIAESAQAWRAWVPHFARRYRVIRPDQRGFGASTPMPEDFAWSIDVLVDDLARLADSLGLEKFHLVSAKLGGTVAMKFAAEHPQRLRSLSLVGTPPSPKASLGHVVPEWLAYLERHGARGWAQWTMGNRLGSAMPAEGVRWWADLMGSTALSTLKGIVAMIAVCDVTDDLARIQAPTLVVTTTGSGLGSVEQVRSWQQRIRDSELVVFDRDSYHVAASDPDLCAERVRAFLESARVDRPSPRG